VSTPHLSIVKDKRFKLLPGSILAHTLDSAT
jgi:hypothetical protein